MLIYFENVLLSAITCPGLKNGINTEPVPADLSANVKYLDFYTYSCKEGYATNDVTCTVCLPDGTLSEPAPTCYREYMIISSLFISK